LFLINKSLLNARLIGKLGQLSLWNCVILFFFLDFISQNLHDQSLKEASGNLISLLKNGLFFLGIMGGKAKRIVQFLQYSFLIHFNNQIPKKSIFQSMYKSSIVRSQKKWKHIILIKDNKDDDYLHGEK